MKYFQIHRRYLFNKINIIIIGLILCLSILLTILCLQPFLNEGNYFNKMQTEYDFVENSLTHFKLLIIPLNAYLWGHAFSNYGDAYHLLIKNYYKHKTRYIFEKVILLIITYALMIGVIFYFSFLYISLTSHWFEVTDLILKLYGSYLLLGVIYGLLSALLSKVIKSEFSYFISIILFISNEFMFDKFSNSIFFKVYQIFFPTFNQYTYLTSYGFPHLISLLCIYTLIICTLCNFNLNQLKIKEVK